METCTQLSDQGTKEWGFTGTMIGMYALNGKDDQKALAAFDWFDYTPQN